MWNSHLSKFISGENHVGKSIWELDAHVFPFEKRLHLLFFGCCVRVYYTLILKTNGYSVSKPSRDKIVYGDNEKVECR